MVHVVRSVVHDNKKLETAMGKHNDGVLRDMCSGTLRHLPYYDRLIDYTAPMSTSKDLTLRILTASTLYQMEQMDRAPSAPALYRALASCCDEFGKQWAAKPVAENCQVIHELGRDARHEMLDDGSRHMLPSWLYRLLRRDAPADFRRYAPLLSLRPDFLTLHVPPEAFGGRDRYAELVQARSDCSAQPGALASHSLVLRPRPKDPASLPGLVEGRVHVQDAVQQYGVSLLSPVERMGGRVLDACAAPGGKTRALFAHQPTLSHVVALEKSPRKVEALRMAMGAAFGEHRVSVRCGDACEPATWLAPGGEKFGAILLDAPCTGSGLLRTRPEVKYHQSEESLEMLCGQQQRMLSALWPLLSPGGEMLYTTCSVLSAENEKAVEAFVSATSDARSVALQPPTQQTEQPVKHRHGDSNSRQSLRALADATHAVRQRHGMTFYPCTAHQGGYVALLRKVKPTDRMASRPSRRRARRTAAGQEGKRQQQDKGNHSEKR